MRRFLVVVSALAIAYLGVGSLLHFVVFPEAAPPPEDRPRSGTEVRLPGGSTFVYRITAVESDGALFEADWLGEPGAGIPAGVEHRWENAADEPARGVFRLRPAGMADFVFVQLDRAFGGDASDFATAVQTFILIGTHGEHTAWPIETLRFLIAPTARLFGIQSYYPPGMPVREQG